MIIDHHTDQKLWAPLPSCNFNDFTEFIEVSTAFVEEVRWLKEVNNISRTRSSETSTLISGWAQHHATFKRGPDFPPGINTILPLLRDKVNTLKMQRHIMILNINSTKVSKVVEGLKNSDFCENYIFFKVTLFLIEIYRRLRI